MPSDINSSDTEGTKWAKLQAWVKQACINAGISVTGLTDPLLSDINGGESEGIKWSKLQRWIRLLADNIGGISDVPQHRTSLLVTGTRDIAATDADLYLYTTTGSAVSLTVLVDTLPLESEIDLFQAGDGQVTLVAGAGVTIISKDSKLKLAAKGSGASLKQVSANVWHLVGDLSA